MNRINTPTEHARLAAAVKTAKSVPVLVLTAGQFDLLAMMSPAQRLAFVAARS